MRFWFPRILIGLVTIWNLQAGIVFIFSPQIFVHAYELTDTAGEAAVRGVGVLFLMWNIPYLFAAYNPIYYSLALTFALLMQFTGLIGESYILSTIGIEHTVLRSSILRFIAFDGIGLILLFAAWMIIRKNIPSLLENQF